METLEFIKTQQATLGLETKLQVHVFKELMMEHHFLFLGVKLRPVLSIETALEI